MSGTIPNHEMITQYLLGALPEAETERCDELSITDDQFAELLKTVEKDLVDAYVRQELTGATLARFESHYLSSARRREQVEFARALQAWGEREVNPQSSRSGFAGKANKATKVSWLARFFNTPQLAWGLALVTLLLCAATGGLVWQNLQLRRQVIQTQARHDDLWQREQDLQRQIATQQSATSQAEAQLVEIRRERERLEQQPKNDGQSPPAGKVVFLALAAPVRGAESVPTVSLGAGDTQIAVRLQLESADYPAYRVTVQDPGGNQVLWRSGPLKARLKGDNQSLSVRFPASLLKPRTYAVRVTGISANGSAEVVSDYPFRTVK